MHLVLAAADSREALQRELAETFPGNTRELAPGLFACETESELGVPLPYLVFSRQIMPHAERVQASSIRDWAALLAEALCGVLPDQQPWSLHVFPFKESAATTRLGARAWHTHARTAPTSVPELGPRSSEGVGYSRCRLIRETSLQLLHKRRRHLAPYLREEQGLFVEDEALVQLVLTSNEQGFLSIALPPTPFVQRHVLSWLAGGEVEPAVDKQAPSRAFTKLVESELRMCRRITSRDTCVDLGASPGSWTYVAARRGARVTAIDRAELRADLMDHRLIRFQRGDAFRFEPDAAVDWLLCDVIAAAERSAELLVRWLRQGWCRHFVVTLKVDDAGSSAVLAQLKSSLPGLTSELWLQRLCSNKKEVCAFGTIAEPP